MRPPKSQTAFTLVELLVVIAIIGTLMGLLLPAVQAARESGRRNTCTNNINQLGKAIINYEAQKQSLPGWRHKLTTSTGTFYPVSWPVTILPQVERLDIYRLWEQGNGTTIPQSPYLALFVCPTAPAPDQTSPWISYAGNAGTGTQNKADGVFLDTIGGGVYNAARTNLDVISSKDGAANTLLFSEKCGMQIQSPNRWSGAVAAVSGSSSLVFVENSVPSVFGIGNDLPGGVANGKIINSGSATPSATPSDFGYLAQPNGNHPGGVVAAFADGHTMFLKDSMQSFVYAQLLTSDYINASVPRMIGTGTSWLYSPAAVGNYILQDSDY